MIPERDPESPDCYAPDACPNRGGDMLNGECGPCAVGEEDACFADSDDDETFAGDTAMIDEPMAAVLAGKVL